MSIETTDSREVTPGDLLGTSVQRREDPHLISGESEYTDDIQYPRQTHLSLLRSQYAHAEIDGIDTSAAEAMDKVVAVYTQEDIYESGVPGVFPDEAPDFSSGPARPLLAEDKVVFQGQPIVAVVAEDRYTAAEATKRIDVDYNRLDAAPTPEDALAEDAAPIHDEVPDNTAYVWENGDAEETEQAFAEADRIVEIDDIENNRVVPTAMEPRAASARYKSSTDEIDLALSTQNPHKVQDYLSNALGVPDHKIRVRPPDVGGGFGAKLQPYSGYILAVWCSMQVERPVKWTATRTEDFQSMVHSRHQISRAEVALDDDNSIIGMRVKTIADQGAYVTFAGAGIFTSNFGRMFTGQYDIPAAHIEVTSAYTNTTPLSAYRGAGRPEATYFIERIAQQIAREIGVDPVEFRKQNFIPEEAFPHETPIGHNYDSGAYAKNLDKALDIVDYEAFRERQAAAREEGRYLGLGISCYVEACGAAPGWTETGAVRVKPSGKVVIESGTSEIGTGHRTGYTQIVANRLGVSFDDIEVEEGDTAAVPEGGGTGGSRAMPVGGSALYESAEEVREKARRIAADQLEAAPEDIEVGDGEFHVRGAPDRAVTLGEIAEAAYTGDIPDDIDPGLEATTYYDPANYTYPFGTHIAIVEVDPASGEIEFDRYVAVDDVGEQINPKIVEGQIHGGVVQGIGQAIYEGAEYDENGTLISGSLQDYAIPKAAHVPEIEWDSTITPSPHNPLGVKGVGEAGAIGAPPAVVNAVCDALEPFGIRHIDMPMTAERVWQRINDAET